MSIVREAGERLEAALNTVDGLRGYLDPGANVDPPAWLLGAPRLQWESGCLVPTSATFVVFVITAVDDRALESLWELVPAVAEAVDSILDAAVTTATPGMFVAGSQELPCYEITVEMSLT